MQESSAPHIRSRAMSCWPLSSPAICETRPVISAAARSERVISRIRLGSAPLRMRCATRELGIGFARSRTGDGEKRWPDRAILPHAVLGGTALVGIEFTKMCRGCRHGWLPQRKSMPLR